MSPAARILRARLERRVEVLAPELRVAMLKAFAAIQDKLSPSFTLDRIANRDLASLLVELDVEGAFTPVSNILRDGVERAALAETKALPVKAARTGIIDFLKPDVVEAIRTLNTAVMRSLSESTRDAVRKAVELGLQQGTPPKTIARGLRDVVGLAPKDVDAVANFRRMLEEKDSEALTRLLRDKRFDSTIRKAFAGDGLTGEQIDKMVERYRTNAVANNAETIARTASMDAQKLGQQMAYQEAVARGNFDGGTLVKRWSGTLDDRERPEHLAMEGETVPWNQPYSNGEMVPGSSTFNCRCVSIFASTGKTKPGAGAFGVAPDDLRVGELLRG